MKRIAVSSPPFGLLLLRYLFLSVPEAHCLFDPDCEGFLKAPRRRMDCFGGSKVQGKQKIDSQGKLDSAAE